MNEFLERTNVLTNNDEKTEQEQKNEKLMRESEKDEQVLIKDEKKAVIVGPMTYFFGDRNLPMTEVPMLRNTINGKSPLASLYPRASDTVTFKTTNNDSMTVYGVAALTRCSKSLDEVVSLGRRQANGLMPRPQSDVEKVIINDKNGVVNELAWFCPQSIKCCEWECCSTVEKPHNEFDPPDEDFVGSVHLVAFLFFVCALAALCVWCCKEDKEEISTEPTGNTEQSVEMVPLVVADYPKQLRSNPAFTPLRDPQQSAPEANGGANIGWTVKPSAPSAPRVSEDS
ncbi:hypothetical protein PRIPAC_87142 [Pristionchus pacificus]|nr:hypothetical protein PRIPAC_87142 [Pristionchus pacificus]